MNPQQQFDILDKSPNLTLATRIRRLKKLKQVMNDKIDNLISAINKDFGRRCSSETQIAEIMVCNEEIKHTLKHIKSWVKPKSRSADIKFLFSKNVIMPQPLGVVGIISPWNYPFNLAIAPLIAAIAAGNKVMIKPSELTPNTADFIAELMSEVFEETEVAVSVGDLEVAKQFSELPFKHLLFTGSTAVGKIIMKNASCHLTPVTLELGGKSPVIIDENYNIDKAAKSIVGGKYFNAGQTCIAPDYILVPENIRQQLTDSIIKEIKKSFPDILNNTDYTAIINQRHFNRLKSLSENCKESGKIWPLSNNMDSDKHIFPPLLILNPELNSKVMQEEIFGPILPIISVKDIQDCINIINSMGNPLTLYVFSNSSKYINNLLDRTLSGSVAVNETLVQFAQDGTPFGGVGDSGMGSYHGKNGFESFSHMKTIYYQSRLNFNSLVRAPFTPLKKKIINLLRKL